MKQNHRLRRRADVGLKFIVFIQAIASVYGVCPRRWVSNNGDCYFFSSNKFSNSDAKSRCVSMGANLSSIHDESEFGFISKQTAKKDYWIGLYKEDSSPPSNQSYAWLDGIGQLTVSSKNCNGAGTGNGAGAFICAVFAQQKVIECNQDCTSSNRFICRRQTLPPNATSDLLSDYPDYDNDSTSMIDTVDTDSDIQATSNEVLSTFRAPPTPETTNILVSNVSELSSLVVSKRNTASQTSAAVETGNSSSSAYVTVTGATNRSSEEDLSLIRTSETPTTYNDDLFVRRCSFPPDFLLLPEDLQFLSFSDPILLPDGSAAVYYVCRTGFAFVEGGTARSAICQNEQWTETHGCQAIRCSMDVQLLTCGEVAVRTCNDSQSDNERVDGVKGGNGGRFADGTQQEDVKCVRDVPLLGLTTSGRLHRATSVCSDIYCEAAPLVLNATLTMNAALRTATFTCWPGQRFSDGSSVKVKECNSDNSWNYDIGSCAAVFCEMLPTPLNGSLSTKSVAASTVVTVQCDRGFTFDDGNNVKSLTCLETGTWNATVYSVCKPVYCVEPPLIRNASIESALGDRGLFPFDARIDYVCDVIGQRFPDGSTRKSIACDERGNWNHGAADLSCDYGRCDPVPSLDHVRSNTSSTDQGTVVEYSCDPGYVLSNTSAVSITCDGSKWSSYDVQCKIVRCPLPILQSLLYGDLNTLENAYGTRLLVSCYHGYQLTSGMTTAAVVCTEYGHWSEDITCTAVECGPLPVVMNSQLVSSGPMTYGTNVTVTCLHGYWFTRDVVNMTIFCEADGNWTNLNYSSCTHVSCPPLAPLILSTTNTSVNAVVNVSCSEGYYLTTRQLTVLTTCDASGHWTPHVPDCIEEADGVAVVVLPVFEAKYSDAFGLIVSAIVIVVSVLLLLAFDLPNIRGNAIVFRRNFLRTFNNCLLN